MANNSKLKPFKVLSRERIAEEGILALNRLHLESPYTGEAITRPLVTGSGDRDYVVVIPRDNKGRFYLKREWRGAQDAIIWEFPGGGIDLLPYTSQDALDAANRELQEEVDIKAGKMTKLTEFELGNYIRMKCLVYFAEDLSESSLDADEHEHIEVGVFEFDEAKRLIHESTPTAQSLIALHFAEKIHKGEKLDI